MPRDYSRLFVTLPYATGPALAANFGTLPEIDFSHVGRTTP
jgi:hypothetical protein